MSPRRALAHERAVQTGCRRPAGAVTGRRRCARPRLVLGFAVAARQGRLGAALVFEGGFTMESPRRCWTSPDTRMSPDHRHVQSLLTSLSKQVSDGGFDMLVSVKEYAWSTCAPRRFPGSGPSALAPGRGTAQRVLRGTSGEARVAGACWKSTTSCGVPAAAPGGRGRGRGALEALGSAQFARAVSVGVEARFASERHGPGWGGRPRAKIAGKDCAARSDASGRVAEARTHLEAALRLARRGRGTRGARRACLPIWRSHRRTGAWRSPRFSRACAGACSRAERSDLECLVLNALARWSTIWPSRRIPAHWRLALALARRIGDRRWEGGLLGNLAACTSARGDSTRRGPSRGRAGVARELGDRKFEGNALCNLAFFTSYWGGRKRRQAARGGAGVVRKSGTSD